MNTVERIVSCYFQMVRHCLTASDTKVVGGNNRQFDLLACNLCTGDRYHVEASVTHELRWCPTLAEIELLFHRKFFGVPTARLGPNTDHSRKKTYLPQVKKTYEQHGFDFQTITRVWCCWKVFDADTEQVEARMRAIASEYGVVDPKCEVLYFRDKVLPDLTKAIAKSNYDDDVLRMISLLEQRRVQTERSGSGG